MLCCLAIPFSITELTSREGPTCWSSCARFCRRVGGPRSTRGMVQAYAQLDRIPNDATHLVVSAGGNDALGEAAFLEEKADSVAEIMAKLADVREQFGTRYRSMLDLVLDRKLPTAVCTIYDPRFPDAHLRRIAAGALSVFNAAITREAFARHIALI